MAIGIPTYTKRHENGTIDPSGTVFTVTYEGAVLGTRERNMHEDSDFFAIVWDEEKGALREIEYATTRFYTYDCYATVDATDEVKEKARRWLVEQAYQTYLAHEARNARRPGKGKTVKVTNTRLRRVPAGTTGEVFWVGIDQYGQSRYSHVVRHRIGLKDADGTAHWVKAADVEVVDPAQYERPAGFLRLEAERHWAKTEEFSQCLQSGFYTHMSGLHDDVADIPVGCPARPKERPQLDRTARWNRFCEGFAKRCARVLATDQTNDLAYHWGRRLRKVADAWVAQNAQVSEEAAEREADPNA